MEIKKTYEQLKPLLARFLPVVEHFVTGTNFSSALVGGAAVAATVDMSEVHEHLDTVSKTNAALLRQLQDQTVQIAGVEEEVKRLRMALEHSERRVESIEREVASLGTWVKALGGTAVVLLVIVAVMMYVLRAK